MDSVLNNLQSVQMHCVKILEVIDEICRDNNIQYSLTGGSVIGAHLYNGIIPWDDDIDIMMTRDNYEKFLALCDLKLPPKYQIKNFENGKDRTLMFSKLVDEDTTVIELKSGGKKVVSGIFVDITVMDKVPIRGIKKRMFFMLAKALQCCRERNYEKITSVRNVARNISIFILKPFSNTMYNKAKRYITKNFSGEYTYAELFAGFNICFEKKLFDKYTDIVFEGKKFMIVEDYMSYLETRYGKRDFYKEQRTGDLPHHLIYVDCEKPYRSYQD